MSKEDDDLAVRLAILWLSRYVQLSRVSPALVERLRVRTDEFELVPIPHRLLSSVASAALPEHPSEDPPAPGSAASGPEEPEDGFRAFAKALGGGDLEAAAARLHPAYLDSGGRQLADLRNLLERVLEATASRDLAVERIEIERRDPDQAVLRACCRWQARLAGTGEEAVTLDEPTLLSVDLHRVGASWLISGITPLEASQPDAEASVPTSEGEALR